MAITVGVLVTEVIGAVISGSLGLLADAGHMLTDVAGLTLGLIAAALARRPATQARTWGYRRAEVLGAAAQAAVLLAVGVFILVEGVQRLLDPPEVTPGVMVVFGAVGLVGNIIGLAVLAGGRGDNQNMKGCVPRGPQRRARLGRSTGRGRHHRDHRVAARGRGRVPGHRGPHHPAHHRVAARERRRAAGVHPQGGWT